MKKYPGILKRAELTNWKAGHSFARTDGSLYKWLSAINVVLIIYTFFINLFYTLGTSEIYRDTEYMSDVLFPVITVSIATAFFVASLIFSRLKFKITASALNIAPCIYLIIIFGLLLKNEPADTILDRFNPVYYWRHFVPLLVIFILSVIMLVIAIRARVKLNKIYLKTEEKIYTLFKENYPDSDESQWIAFAEKYDGTSPQKLFGKKKKSKKDSDTTESDDE